MGRLSSRLLILLLSAMPLRAALDFNSGNFGTVAMSNTIFLFTPTGGTGPYVFSYAPGAAPIPNFRVINDPELPTFANAAQKGGIVGLPLAPGLQSTTIRLTDTATNLFVDKAVSFTVNPLDLAGFGPNYYSIGDTVNQRFWPVGGTPPYSYTLSGTLPPGLTLGTQVVNGTNVALVSGTILNTAITATTTSNNNYNFTITIHDSVGNQLNRGYAMSVSAMQLSIAGSPLNSGGNRNLPNATVGLAYSQQINVTGGTPPYTFGLLFLNAPPSPLTLSPSGLISGTPTGSNFGGRFTISVTDAANHYMTARLAIKVLPTTPIPLAFSTNVNNDSPVGSNFTNGFYATGGLPPYTFDVDPSGPLPTGAFLVQGPEAGPDTWDPDPAYVRMKVQTPGTFSFTLRVTDSAGNRASRAYILNVPSLTLNYIFASNSLNGPPLADAVLGTPYTRYLMPLGGTPPYTVVPTNLSAGLTVDNNGRLFGTPLEAGLNLPMNFILNDSASNRFTVPGNVSIASLTTPGLSLSGGDFGTVQRGSNFSSNLTASGSSQNPPTFTVSLISGSVPPGMQLLTGKDFNNNGNPNVAAQLAGVPTTPGTYAFVYRVVDGLGQVGQRQVKLRVSGMAIVNTGFAPGTVGVPYTQTVDVRGGTPPYTFSLTTGSLPPNLSFNTATGTISGTPTSTNSTGVTIQVQDSNPISPDILQRSFTLNIYPIQITGADVLPNAFFGAAYSYTVTPNPAGSYTFTATGLPAGLGIDSTTGVISGIPTATGTFGPTITAFNNATGAVVVRSFTLFLPPVNSIINGLPSAVVMVGGVPTAYLGDFLVGTNTVTTLGVAGGRPPYNISLVSPSVLPPGLALAISSTYQGNINFSRWGVSGVPTTAGLYTFTLRYTDADGLTTDRVVAMNITTLGLATTVPSTATVNQPYTAQLYGEGGTGSYTFSLLPLPYLSANVMPPGLTLSSTGTISGTPTSTGVFNPQILLTSGGAFRRVTLTITVNATSDLRRIDFSQGPFMTDGSAGRSRALALTPSGGAGTHTWSVVAGALPPAFNLITGANLVAGVTPPSSELIGAVPTPGTYNFRIRVDDSTGNFGVRDTTWIVSAMRLSPVNFPLTGGTVFPPGSVGVPYSFTVNVLNGRAPFTYTADPTGTLLPGGMTFSSTGVLSGIPTSAGNFPLFFTITDADGNVAHVSATISVYPGVIPITNGVGTGALLPSATVGTGYTQTLNDLLTPGFGTPPITWTQSGGTLPAGISITPGSGSTSAALSGTPTVPGTYTFSLTARDANNRSILVYQLQMIVTVLGLNPNGGALPPAVVGIPYSTSVLASGGTGPYTFTTEYDSDMPPGLSLAPNGVISGTPTLSGPFVLYLIGTDAANNVYRQRFSINVSPAGTVTPSFTLTPSSINLAYTIGDPVPPPIPISVGSTSGSLSYTATASGDSGGGWISLSSGAGTTPSSPNANINPTLLAAGTHNGTLTFTSAGASNSPANIPVTVTVSAAVVCRFSLSPTAGTALAAGGPSQFSVGFGFGSSATCGWTVDTASIPAWITLTSAASGTGSGSVQFTVQPNAGTTSRVGVITVNGLAYTLTQFGTTCSFTIVPLTSSTSSAGGSAPLAVNASASTCAWNSTPIDPWISILPTSGVGSATVQVTVGANLSAASRIGTMSIAGQTYTLNQAGVGCSPSLSSAGTSISSSGGPTSFNITAPAGCTWSADTGPSWITATSPVSGSGNGSINLSIAPTSTATGRSAAVKVGTQSFTVTQAGLPCSFSLSSANGVQPYGGGLASIDIAANAGCGWTASTAASWLTPASASGSGAGNLSLTVAANGTGAARSATLTIVGQNITISQSGPVCSYTLLSSSAAVPAAGSAGTIGVSTSPGCPSTAVSNAPTWLHIADTGSYSGTATSNFRADANLTGADRLGSITIAGLPFTVTQPALPCGVTVGPPASTSLGEFGGSSQFTYTTSPPGCVVNVQSNSSWLTVTDLSTPGTVKFAAAANTYAAARSATISVGSQSFQVDEAASSCAYTLTSFASPLFSNVGGAGTVPMTFAPAACGPPPVIVNGPLGMVTLGNVIGGTGTYTQNFSVSTYLSFINYIRTTQLVINGQIFTVKQSSW